MRKEPTIIAFSGGCFAGKTTLINALQEELRNEGRNVRVVAKVRYTRPIVSIDDIRKDTHEYLKYEEYVTRGMMTLENDAFESRQDDIIILDRTVLDSLFYALFYLDKSALSKDELVTYHNLITDSISHIEFAYENIYDHVIFLSPRAESYRGDTFRPKHVDILKYTESAIVSMMNKAYAPPLKLSYFNTSLTPSQEIITYIKELVI